ncbi:MAG: peptide deformylase [Rhodospirillaceae bacterium]
MALLPILTAPDPRLKIKAEPVGQVDAEIAQLMDDMLETMYDAPGIGLAAPQVGVSKRVIVVDAAREGAKPEPYLIADPEILWASEDTKPYDEGCLSVPEFYESVNRPASIQLRYRDQNNVVQTMDANGLLAVVIQYEMDHLEGILFIDHLSSLKRNMILRKLKKTKKLQDVSA